MTNNASQTPPRVIGFDSHPDSFTAALLRGPTPAAALIEKVFHKVPIGQLSRWAQKHTAPEDLIVLEASGNSFQVVRILERAGRKALVLESCQLGKLKEAHANNDKISAVRIGKAYLAGTAKVVWVPDPLTQERRDWFQAYQKTTKRTTQMTNRIGSYLSDNGVRLAPNASCTVQKAKIRQAKNWSPRQWQVIEGMLLELSHAQAQRDHWSSLMAQEVISDPLLLSLVRLCGIRDVIAFALGAIIGDINRFATPKNLVGYVGLNPAYDHTGLTKWEGGVGGRGRADLRSLLIEAAQAILRSGHPLAKWGKRLLAKKSSETLVAAAVARRLTVAIWYLMKGRWTTLEEIDKALSRKVGKIITKIGKDGREKLAKTRKALRAQIYESLMTARTYVLDPDKKYAPEPAAPKASPKDNAAGSRQGKSWGTPSPNPPFAAKKKRVERKSF